MCGCGALLEAIDRYIEKADGDLADALGKEGYADPKKAVRRMESMEDGIADALTEETEYFEDEAEGSEDLEDFAGRWEKVKAADKTAGRIAGITGAQLREYMPGLVTAYIRQTDRDLKLEQVSRRTTAWVREWSGQLGRLMQLDSHEQIEKILTRGLEAGDGIAEFTRAIQDSGIRDEYYRARRVAVTEVLRAHSVAQQESFMQSPSVVKKAWRHTGEYRNKPRENHVAMDGQTVDKGGTFTLLGADGETYEPMYPRDTVLPPGESVNCHCICQPVVDESILGMTLAERQALQQKAVDEMDDEWEKEQNAKNRLRGVDGSLDEMAAMTRAERVEYLGSEEKEALYEAGIITDDDMLKNIKVSTLQELHDGGIMTVSDAAQAHSTVGDFTALGNPKKAPGKQNGGRMTGGGHSQSNIEELERRGITYHITKTYENGVRVGGVDGHKNALKQTSGQSWFPENWNDAKVRAAGTYTSNNPAIVEEMKDASGNITGYRKFQEYEDVVVGIFEDPDHNVTTIFPDSEQRKIGD